MTIIESEEWNYSSRMLYSLEALKGTLSNKSCKILSLSTRNPYFRIHIIRHKKNMKLTFFNLKYKNILRSTTVGMALFQTSIWYVTVSCLVSCVEVALQWKQSFEDLLHNNWQSHFCHKSVIRKLDAP